MTPAAIAGAVVLVAVIAWRRTVTHEDPWMIMIGYSALAVALGGGVLYAATSRSIILGSVPLRTLGKYSYGLYVLHYPIVIALRLSGRVSEGWTFAAVMIPLSLAAAYLSYHLLESPFLRLKDRFGVGANRPAHVLLPPGSC
jgi:peptidoglycan/LPS O-acetylase OafA/YrhL